MEVKPGYKMTEVGVIPEDWDVVELGQLVEPSENIRYGVVQPGEYDRSGCLMVRSQDYSKGWVDEAHMHRVCSVLERQYKNAKVKRSDLVLTIVGAGIGQVAEVPGWLDGAILSRSTGRISLNSEMSSACYVKSCLGNDFGKKQIFNAQKEGAQPVVSCKDLSKLKLPYPPLEEQKSIASALSDVDALIESLEQLLAKKRNIKQGAMQELLTGKRRLPGFSGEWEEKSLGELFEFSGGFTASRDQLSCEGYCYLHYGDIHTSNKMFVDVAEEYQEIPKLGVEIGKVSRSSLLEDGDVVFVDASEDEEGVCRYVVVVNPAKVPFISGLHTIVSKVKGNCLDNLYKRYCFQSEGIKRQFRFYAVGTKVSGVNKKSIRKISIQIPKFEEQVAIGAILNNMDAELAAIEVKLSKARHLKQAMMQELLTGRIRLV